MNCHFDLLKRWEKYHMYWKGQGKTLNGFHYGIASSYLNTERHLEILPGTLSLVVTLTSQILTGEQMLKRN